MDLSFMYAYTIGSLIVGAAILGALLLWKWNSPDD